MRKLLMVMAAMTCMSAAAQAQNMQPYAGLGLGVFGVEEKEPGFNQKSTTFGGYAKFGVDVNDFVGAELRIGATSKGTKSWPAGTLGSPVPFDVSLSADNLIAYLVKLQYPVTPDVRLYALVGATTSKIKLSVSAGAATASASKSKTGFSYGFGGEYFVNPQISVGGEWVQYLTDVKLNTVSKARLWGAAGTLSYHF